MTKENFLKLTNITKKFPGVVALDGVHLDVKQGEVHSLCGENGAGKSTLMKIISGAQPFTSGKMYINGVETQFNNTNEAEEKGISMIYQEFNMCPELSVAENILMGNLPKNKFGMVDWKQMYQSTQVMINDLGVNFSSKELVKDLSVAQVQMCEILKAMYKGSKLIIMDEPTAALTKEESEILFENIEMMKKAGMGIIYVSHRMDEIFKISDRITVFRNGKYIDTLNVKDTNYSEIVSLMVGRDVNDLYPERDYSGGEVILELKNIISKNVDDVSLSLHKGEILGLAGLLGAGNIDLARSVFSANKLKSGQIFINNEEVVIHNPKDAFQKGIALVSEDRKQEGLVLIRNVKDNVNMASLEKVGNIFRVNSKLEKERTSRQISNMNIKVSSDQQECLNLSGGNQQKVVLGKVLETDAFIYFLNEPTRGVDVGAKQEIYEIINNLTNKGYSVVISSSDLPELVGMCDRVLVFKDGKIVDELRGEEITQNNILASASGGKD